MTCCNFARLMGEHKLLIVDIASETGLSRYTVTLLYKETVQKVDLALEQICILLDYGVGSLLELHLSNNKQGAGA